jgi:hypothetical protein
MIWLAVGVVVYGVVGLCLLALCRAASWGDGQVRPSVREESAPRAA